MVPYSARAAMGAAGKEQCQKLCLWIPFLQHKEIRTGVLDSEPADQSDVSVQSVPPVGSAMTEEAMSCQLLTTHTAACPRHKGGSKQDLLEGLPLHTLGCRLASGCTLEL